MSTTTGPRTAGLLALLAALLVCVITVLHAIEAMAVSQKTKIGVAQFKSTVEDISAPVARELLIKALAKTSQFAIPPQKSSNKITGVEYIVDGAIKQAKATPSSKTNALTFFRAAVADDLISVEVRVFEASTMSLIDTISARSGDINTSKKFGAGDAASILGALAQAGGLVNAPPPGNAAAGNAAPDTTPDTDKMEQRLEPLITEIANQIAERYGTGQMQASPGMDLPFGLVPDYQPQQPPAQSFAPAAPSPRRR